MKKLLVLLISLLFVNTALPQMRIIYGIRQDGKESKTDSIVVYISKESMRITRPVLVKEKQYADFVNKKLIQFLEDGNLKYVFKKDYQEKQQEIIHEYPVLNGYNCQKTRLNIRSNNIEVYFTEDANYKGAPALYLSEIPGLVLKVVRNGNYEIYAKQIDIIDEYKNMSIIPGGNIPEISESVFQQKLIESRYKTVEVFENQQLSFEERFTNNFSGEIIKTAKGSVVLRKMNFPETNDNTIVIAELTLRSNGDAYDRLGSVFVFPESSETNLLKAFEKGISELPEYKNSKCRGITLANNYQPPIELMRFITSFGTGHFGKDININGLNWKDSIVYRLDVSDIMKSIGNKATYIGALIGNWDKGGHIVSLRLKYFDEPEYENKINWILPLFNTTSYMEMEGQQLPNLFKTDTLTVKAEVPEGIKNIKLKFVTTGHGKDEFIPRNHKIFLNGKEVFNLMPWRTDCASYREYNPASGNFPNGMSSSDYSRSNWCPGLVVTPYEIKLESVKTGINEIKVIIDSGDNSYWNVSGCLTGEK